LVDARAKRGSPRANPEEPPPRRRRRRRRAAAARPPPPAHPPPAPPLRSPPPPPPSAQKKPHHHNNNGQDSTVRKIKSLPGLVASADLKARSDTTLSLSHNVATKATKMGITYDALKLAGKKSAVRLNYVTPGNNKSKQGVFTGELGTTLASNKKSVVAFNEKGLVNVKLLLTDDQWTYEPSYNLLKKAPSLGVSRPVNGGKGGKVRMTWNLKTDDLTGEWQYQAVRFVAVKRPDVAIPTVGVAMERAFMV
jgi:hypothetical protein